MPCDNSARRRSKTMAFRCTPEERKLICDMAAWSGMSRQDYIIAKLTDTQVEVRPSVSVQKALKDSMVSSNPLRYQQSAESGTASQRAWVASQTLV